MIAQKYISAKEFICNLFQAFEIQNLSYVVLRGYEGLPTLVSNDIDIFILPKDYVKAQKTLNEISRAIQICSVISHFGLKKYVLKFRGNEIVTVDLFNAISWKGFLFADTTAIIKNTKKHNGITVSKEGVEAAIVVLKELLMFGKIKSRDNAKDRIHYCLKLDDISFTTTIEPFLGVEVEWLKRCVTSRNWQDIEENTNAIRRKIVLRNLAISPTITILNTTKWAIKRFLDIYQGKRGCFVAIIGPDGSGKTTLVNAVNKQLAGNLFTKTNHFASNFEILPLLSSILQFLKRKRTGFQFRGIDQFQGMHSGMQQKVNSPFRSCIYILWYSLDLILGRFILLKKKSQGELIFFARYYYDYYYQRANRNAPKWLLNFMLYLIPKPDLVFYIDRDACNIYKLKPELSVQEIERQQRIILELAEKHNQFVRIEGNDGIESSKEQIVDALAKLLANRLPR